MSKLYNLARVNTATTGTGTMTLGAAVSGFLTFANAGAVDGDVVSYAIRDGANSEIGTGTYNAAGPTLTRTNILRSTNSNTAISLSGTAQVFITPNTADFSTLAPLIAPSFTGPVLINTPRPTAQLAVANVWTNNDARYRKLITLAARPAQFRLSDQPPAEHIVGDLMVSDGNIVLPSFGSKIFLGNPLLSSLTTVGAVPTLFVGSMTPGDTAGKYLAVKQGSTNPEVFLGSDISTYGIIGTSSNHPLGFRTNNVLGMTLNTSGNLGIGIVPGSVGSYNLEVNGSALFWNTVTALNSVTVQYGTPVFQLLNTSGATDEKFFRMYANGNALNFDIVNDAYSAVGTVWLSVLRSANTVTLIAHNVATSGIHTWQVNAVEKMRLSGSGGLTLGATTDAGAACLLVSGRIGAGIAVAPTIGAVQTNGLAVQGATTDVGPVLTIIASASLGGGTTINNTWFTGSTGPLIFQQAGSEVMRLDASGNLGIGITPSGTFKLEVGGMLNLQVGTPEIWLSNTAAGTDAKIWRTIVSGSQMFFDICNDAATVEGGVWLTVTRSGNALSSVVFGSDISVPGIGVSTTITTTGAIPLLAVGTASFTPQLWIENRVADATGPFVYLRKGRAGATASVSGDSLGTILWAGYDSANAIQSAASIQAVVAATPVSGFTPGYLIFTTSTTVATSVERMRIDTAGNVGIGLTPSGTYKLEVAGELSWTGSAWTSWTPTISGLVSLSSATVQSATWKQYGKIVFWQMRVSCVSNATAFKGFTFTPPTAAVGTSGTDRFAGSGRIDVGTSPPGFLSCHVTGSTGLANSSDVSTSGTTLIWLLSGHYPAA